MDDFSFNIEENVAVISSSKGGWNLELNKVAWGDRPAKYDLRSWSPDHKKMGKGLTFTDEELKALKEKLAALPL
ncbi:MAG: hypothetical protein IKN82_01885 [Treponema sp.]|jgi:hypothetical protein|nr:hypothetical protein [Treponema sp.]